MKRREKRTCPVCDSPIDPSTKVCPYCQTDLSLFDFDSDEELDIEDIVIDDEKSIDDILASIVGEKPTEEKEILEEIKDLGKNETRINEEKPTEEKGEEGVFECPVCGTMVSADATVCPGCGAEFAEEAQFECPVCGAIVDADATKCPECGVEFEGGEEVAPETAEEQGEVPEEAPSKEAEPAVVSTEEEFQKGEATLVRESEVEEEALEEEAPPEEEVATKEVVPEEAVEEMVVEPEHELTVFERVTSKRKARVQEEEALDTRGLYKKLPMLVSEVKPMLISAKKLGIDIGKSRQLINDAIVAGKKRDIGEAVDLVRLAKKELEDSFVLQLSESIEFFRAEVREAKKVGIDLSAVEEKIESSILSLENEDFEGSIRDLQLAKKEFETAAGGLQEVKEELQRTENLVEDARIFGIDVEEATHLLQEGKSAFERKEWDVAKLFARQSREKLIEKIPSRLREEMKRARDTLLELKVRGGDLRKPIIILKRASSAMKERKYVEALKLVKLFRKEIKNIKTGG